MKKAFSVFLTFSTIPVIIIAISWGTWKLGGFFNWSWGDFWSNLISNGASSAVIGFILYWIITRPDEKKATTQRRAQALAMLRIEFGINLQRAKSYKEALTVPTNDFSSLYPLRFTRGAWNALKESGFLPQLNDMEFIFELLRVNEIITIANSSLSTVKQLKADNNKKLKLNLYAKKAIKECSQIENYLIPILAKLWVMDLPDVLLEGEEQVHSDNVSEDNPIAGEEDD